MTVEKLLTVSEVAERTRTSVAFWRKAIWRREIPIVKIGRLTRLREGDVDGFCRLGFRPAREPKNLAVGPAKAKDGRP